MVWCDQLLGCLAGMQAGWLGGWMAGMQAAPLAIQVVKRDVSRRSVANIGLWLVNPLSELPLEWGPGDLPLAAPLAIQVVKGAPY